MRKDVSLISITIVVLLLALALTTYAQPRPERPVEYERELTYQDYLEQMRGVARPQTEIMIPGHAFLLRDQPVALRLLPGFHQQAVVSPETGYLEWEVEIDEPGLYNIAFYYYPLPGKDATIERELLINGERPFAGSRFLQFKRMWKDGGGFVVDVLGNEIRPTQVEEPRWIEQPLVDNLGYVQEPYQFYFKQGLNIIRLVSRVEPMAIGYIKLYQADILPSYEQVLTEYQTLGFTEVADAFVKIQGEHSTLRSDSTLFPIADHGDPTLEPYHPAEIRLNTIGGHRFSRPGQWISWDFEVPQDGFYKIAIKGKHGEIGTYTNRKVLIDGQTPYAELNSVQFPYASGYQMTVLSDPETKEPYLIPLSKGQHELRLEVVLGALSDVLRVVEDSLYELNTIYRRIIMVTSSNPDPRRSYELARKLPDVIERIAVQAQVFEDLVQDFAAVTGMEGGHTGILRQQAHLLQRMAADPEMIPRLLGEYRDNISAIGTWIFATREQPLQIDYIIVAAPDADLPEATANVGQRLGHEMRALAASFTHDYTLIGDMPGGADSQDQKPLTVWVSAGRDQAQVIKSMIDDTFRLETGIPVNLQLVENMNALLVQATIAGTGPDVAMGLNIPDPMNFGLRGALHNLKEFADYDQVVERFMPSAMVPFMFRDQVYALPDQQEFPMMFYRQDILTELGLTVPQTWDDVYSILPILHRNNMTIGIGYNIFFTLLYQRGLPMYKADGVETYLDTETAIQTFRELTELFNLYDLPIEFNAENRFRLGEMPIVISNYSLFNRLAVFAPELRGEWDFSFVPGTVGPDGSVIRTVAPMQSEATTVLQQQGRGGPAVVITSTADNKNDAWQFLKWWTREDTQIRFGRELESLMGEAGRYPTSNVEAFKQLPWSVEEREKLLAQWAWVEGNGEVPGSYYMTRMFEWAFRAVVIQQKPIRETLLEYDRQINYELQVKRSEFGLETDLRDVPERWQELYWDKFTHVKAGG